MYNDAVGEDASKVLGKRRLPGARCASATTSKIPPLLKTGRRTQFLPEQRVSSLSPGL